MAPTGQDAQSPSSLLPGRTCALCWEKDAVGILDCVLHLTLVPIPDCRAEQTQIHKGDVLLGAVYDIETRESFMQERLGVFVVPSVRPQRRMVVDHAAKQGCLSEQHFSGLAHGGQDPARHGRRLAETAIRVPSESEGIQINTEHPISWAYFTNQIQNVADGPVQSTTFADVGRVW